MVLTIYGAGGIACELICMADPSVFVSDDPTDIGMRAVDLLGTVVTNEAPNGTVVAGCKNA